MSIFELLSRLRDHSPLFPAKRRISNTPDLHRQTTMIAVRPTSLLTTMIEATSAILSSAYIRTITIAITVIITPYCASASVLADVRITPQGRIFGWAYDTKAPSTILEIRIIIDKPITQGQEIGDTHTASSTNVAFAWQIPTQFMKSVHLYYIYAVGVDGVPVLIDGTSTVYPTVSAKVTGTPSAVYEYNKQACNSMDIPDHPARAFRTSDGKIHIIATWIHNMINQGDSIFDMSHNCDVVYDSEANVNFQKFAYWEWPQGPYTIDGNTVYIITHNEWYGSLVDTNCNGDSVDSWVSAMTLLVSHDGGKTFSHPADYIIRNPTTLWSNTFSCTPKNPTRYGDLGGSNVIKLGNYYYKFFRYEPEPTGNSLQEWTCLLRTPDLSNPEVYQVYQNNQWVASKTAPCTSISGAMNFRSVTYNTYLRFYVGVAQSSNGGFSFSLSKDLLNWSVPVQIDMATMDSSMFVYPSLIDPSDASMNFENTGKSPLLFVTRFRNNNDNDLIQMRLVFDIQ